VDVHAAPQRITRTAAQLTGLAEPPQPGFAFDAPRGARHPEAQRSERNPVDHISLSDPVTWVGILVASFLIAGLRWVLRGGARRMPDDEGPG